MSLLTTFAGLGTLGAGTTLAMELDFRLNGTTALSSAIVSGPSSLSFTRATSATAWDENGTLITRTSGNHRFDHDPADELLSGNYRPLGVLIEGAATNELLQSEDITTTWTNVGATLTANDVAAPDGLTTADKGEDASAGAFDHFHQTIIVAADGTSWCFSFFVPKDTNQSRFPGIGMRTTAAMTFAQVDTKTGAIHDVSSVFDSFGVIDAGSWWRFWFVKTNDSIQTTVRIEVYPAIASTFGINSAAATGFTHFWGFLLENTVFGQDLTV